MADPQANILIVDDVPANLRLLAQILTDHGYSVRAVTGGARALESVQAALPDLILLDIRMPEMDGFEVCERLKADPLTRDIPVIFISALDDVEDKVRAFRIGGVDYVTKPFQIEEVIARTETHLALCRLKQDLLAANRRYQRELKLAGHIQASFLPHPLPDLPGWEIAAQLAPSRETSGDFYDVIRLPGGQVALMLGDVVDKGAGAALYMALSWGQLRAYLEPYAASPTAVFEQTNRQLTRDSTRSDFVTVFLGILNLAEGRLVYASAGHCPALLLRASGEVETLERTGTALGLFDWAEWQQGEVELQAGDLLLVYTDGVTEAADGCEQSYGFSRLEASLRACAHQPATRIADDLLADVAAYACEGHLQDDAALIVLRRAPT